MSVPNIKVKKIDRNFFTGSADTFRRLTGGYYTYSDDIYDLAFITEYTEEGTEYGRSAEGSVLKYSPVVESLMLGTFHDVAAREISDPLVEKIKYAQINVGLQQKTNMGPICRYRWPVRIIGDNSISNDDEWKKILLGGSFGDKQYTKLFSEQTYDIFGYEYDTYYHKLQKNKIELTSERAGTIKPSLNMYDIGYRYNSYLRQYQQHIENLHERLMPSVYLNQFYILSQDTDDEFGANVRPEIEAFVSREGVVNNWNTETNTPHTSKDNQLTEAPPPHIIGTTTTPDDRTDDGKYKDKSLNLRKYLTGAFVKNELSETTIDYVSEKTKNIYFTKGALDQVFNKFQEEMDGGSDPLITRYPLHTYIKFPIHSPTTDGYGDIISNNNLQEEVLAYLKGTYAGGTLGAITKPIEFVNEDTFYAVKSGETKLTEVTASYEQNLNGFDVTNMFIDILNNNEIEERSDELILAADNKEIMYSKNKESTLRYEKSKNGLVALEQTIDKINNNFVSIFDYKTLHKSNFFDLYTDIHNSIKEGSEFEHEVIAYRIEKVGGPPFGESVTERETKQNIYLFNASTDGLSLDGSTFGYYDTQVKYDEQYTYSVYAYVIVPGLKYRYSNLAVTKAIGKTVTVDDGITTALAEGLDTLEGPEIYCVQFTDPNSGNNTNQLLKEESNILGSMDESYVKSLWMGGFVSSPGPGTEISKAGYAFLDWLAEQMTFVDDPWNLIHDSYFGLGEEGTLWLDTNFSSEYGDFDKGDGGSDVMYGGAFNKLYKDWARIQKKWTIKHSSGRIIDGASGGTTYVDTGDEIDLVDFTMISPFVDNSQITSENKYLADFHFEIEPALKIVQVPLATKTVKVMDHPPVACDISPYQRKDDSNIIGFYINQEAFSLNSESQKKFQDENNNYGIYPTPISAAEELTKSNYLLSNSKLQNQIIYDYSISPITTVNVYRIDYKPTSLQDFNNNLVFQKQLGFANDTDLNYTNCFYEEAVATNQKYYYLFKFINANGVTSYVSPIQVAELVNDGGYKYAVFDTMFETDLVKYDPKQISTNFKKLIHIVPNPRHTEIPSDGIDFSEDPYQLIKEDKIAVGLVDELIWGKKFKFRLTSKKTGKKIDLNVKYKLGK